MAEPDAAPEHLCASAELAERGRALVFDVLQYGQPARAFVLRFDQVSVCLLMAESSTRLRGL